MDALPDKPRASWRRRGLVACTIRAISGSVFLIDAVLRCWYGVRPYSYAESALLRVAGTKADTAVSLGDGTFILPGDPVLDLHVWNERLPTLGLPGRDLAWACRVKNRVRGSLRELAWRLECDPALGRYVAVRAKVIVLSRSSAQKFARIALRFGLVPTKSERPAGWGHGMLILLLSWACDSRRTSRGRYQPIHREYWISVMELRSRYPRTALPIRADVNVLVYDETKREAPWGNMDSHRNQGSASRPGNT